MKTLFIFLTSFLISSCHSNEIDYRFLVGSWKSIDEKNMTYKDETQKITFFANDSLSIEILSEGKLALQLSGKYKIEKNTKTITIKYEDNRSITIKFLKLTEKEMDLQNPTRTLPERYLKY